MAQGLDPPSQRAWASLRRWGRGQDGHSPLPFSPLIGKLGEEIDPVLRVFFCAPSVTLRLEQQDRSQEDARPGCREIIRETQLSFGGAVPPARQEGVCGRGELVGPEAAGAQVTR